MNMIKWNFRLPCLSLSLCLTLSLPISLSYPVSPYLSVLPCLFRSLSHSHSLSLFDEIIKPVWYYADGKYTEMPPAYT